MQQKTYSQKTLPSLLAATTVMLTSSTMLLPYLALADTDTTPTDPNEPYATGSTNTENSEADTYTYLQADNSKLIISVPTEIHVKVTGDGQFITPTAKQCELRNLSIFSIHVAKITSLFVNPFVSTLNASSTDNNVINYTIGVSDGNDGQLSSDSVDVVTLGNDAEPAGWTLTKKDSDGANLAVQHRGDISNVSVDLSGDQQFGTINWVFAAGASGEGAGGGDSGTTIGTYDTLAEYSWTELSAIADDISTNGDDSVYYEHIYSLMKSASTKTVSLAAVEDTSDTSIDEGTTVEVQIIGINHDDKADGSGKAGLTFSVVNNTNNGLPLHPMNSTASTTGGWKSSTMRNWLNSTVATAFKSAIPGIVDVTKTTHNSSGTTSQTTVTTTTDTLFLKSWVEAVGMTDDYMEKYYFQYEGTQYEYYDYIGAGYDKGVTGSNVQWLRTVYEWETSGPRYRGLSKGGAYYTGSPTLTVSTTTSGSDYMGNIVTIPCFCL
jgi:hypothetical protein